MKKRFLLIEIWKQKPNQRDKKPTQSPCTKKRRWNTQNRIGYITKKIKRKQFYIIFKIQTLKVHSFCKNTQLCKAVRNGMNDQTNLCSKLQACWSWQCLFFLCTAPSKGGKAIHHALFEPKFFPSKDAWLWQWLLELKIKPIKQECNNNERHQFDVVRSTETEPHNYLEV